MWRGGREMERDWCSVGQGEGGRGAAAGRQRRTERVCGGRRAGGGMRV